MTYHIGIVRVLSLAEDLCRHPPDGTHLPVGQAAVLQREEVPAQPPVPNLDVKVFMDTEQGGGGVRSHSDTG